MARTAHCTSRRAHVECLYPFPNIVAEEYGDVDVFICVGLRQLTNDEARHPFDELYSPVHEAEDD